MGEYGIFDSRPRDQLHMENPGHLPPPLAKPKKPTLEAIVGEIAALKTSIEESVKRFEESKTSPRILESSMRFPEFAGLKAQLKADRDELERLQAIGTPKQQYLNGILPEEHINAMSGKLL